MYSSLYQASKNAYHFLCCKDITGLERNNTLRVKTAISAALCATAQRYVMRVFIDGFICWNRIRNAKTPCLFCNTV